MAYPCGQGTGAGNSSMHLPLRPSFIQRLIWPGVQHEGKWVVFQTPPPPKFGLLRSAGPEKLYHPMLTPNFWANFAKIAKTRFAYSPNPHMPSPHFKEMGEERDVLGRSWFRLFRGWESISPQNNPRMKHKIVITCSYSYFKFSLSLPNFIFKFHHTMQT